MILTALILATAQPATPPAAPAPPSALSPDSLPGLITDPDDPREPPRELGEAWMRCYGDNATRLIRTNSDEAAAADEAGRLCRPQQQALIEWAGQQRPQATSREIMRNLAFLFFYMREMALANANAIRDPLPEFGETAPPGPRQ